MRQHGSHSQGRVGIGTLTSQYQAQCFFQAVILQAFSRLTVRVEHISQSHSSGVSPQLHFPLTFYLGTTASLSLGLGYLFTGKSWAICPFSNDILRSDPGPKHTHTHTLYLATERSLQFYEFPTHPHLLGLLIALDQVRSKYLFLTFKALPLPNCLSHLNIA